MCCVWFVFFYQPFKHNMRSNVNIMESVPVSHLICKGADIMVSALKEHVQPNSLYMYMSNFSIYWCYTLYLLEGDVVFALVFQRTGLFHFVHDLDSTKVKATICTCIQAMIYYMENAQQTSYRNLFYINFIASSIFMMLTMRC